MCSSLAERCSLSQTQPGLKSVALYSVWALIRSIFNEFWKKFFKNGSFLIFRPQRKLLAVSALPVLTQKHLVRRNDRFNQL